MVLILVNNYYKFIIVLNAKSACSTIRYLFLNLHFDEFLESDKRKIKKRGKKAFHYNNYSYFIHDLDMLYNYEDYHIFSFVRNTYNRICSAFYNRYLNIQYELKFDHISNKKTFMNFLEELPELKTKDIHYMEQCIHPRINEYINIETNNIYDELIRIYNKLNIDDKVIRQLMDYKKMNIKKESSVKYYLNEDLTHYDFCENSKNIKVTPEAIPSYNCLLNSDTLEIIQNIYNKEITHFNFVPV